ncbi:MAG: single-stranded-DNA-specific exonuclease RecJ [Chloroflexota bacterium]
MNHRHWHLLPPSPGDFFDGASGLSPLLAQLLYNRGISPSSLRSFLKPDRDQLGDPFLLPGVPQAVARLYQALLSGETIAVYGDYDVDGITATAIMVTGLARLGSQAVPYIPHRLAEGYGLRTAALEQLKQQGVGLVVSVDCGITAFEPVAKARRWGLDIIITDHHVPLPELPPALALVNPRLPGSAYPFTGLTGAGVAFKLLQALFQSLGRENEMDDFFDLVALGTIADIAPLLGENRYLVRRGLEQISRAPRLGLGQIISRAGLDANQISAENVSWTIAPRLNAAGRLAHALTSYKLLITESPEEAAELGLWLEQKNTERQRLQTRALARAREQVLAQGSLPLLFCGDGDFAGGILGLVAGRLAEEFYRPAVVVKVGEKLSSGSCRSIPEFNIVQALGQCRSLLTEFGGHSQAAGFTLPTRSLPRFQEMLLELAAKALTGVELRPRLDIDAEVSLSHISGGAFREMQALAPFGQGNPLPTLLSRDVKVLDCVTMGSDGGHLRLKLEQGNKSWTGVAFGFGDCLGEVSSRLDIVYNLEMDWWGGEGKLRLNILDFAPAGRD